MNLERIIKAKNLEKIIDKLWDFGFGFAEPFFEIFYKNDLRIMMKIDISEVRDVLEEQEKRDEREKGMQPELSLGCFSGLGREDDDYCQKCRHYQTCKLYLETFRVKEGPNQQHETQV